MPSTSSKKNGNNEAAQKKDNSPGNNSGSSERCTESRARKRKRCEVVKLSESDLESEFEDCDMEDAIAIERKLRKVAKTNALTDAEMRKLLQKLVKNDHVLALVSITAEKEIAQERLEEEQQAQIISRTPPVLKLTRAKARELNKTPGLTLPSLSDTIQEPEITALIKDDLHSDEEDEEYTFKDEDFISDDDPNATVSDMESNPRTPGTPLTANENDDSPVKLTADGCFKIPLDKGKEPPEEMRIATRTRSKLCLQQKTIEDLQSEFVPPDVEAFDVQDTNLASTDEEWMRFLNDFSKPLNSSFVADDDNPIDDPEYVAAEKEPVDAEELRDVNISKKELIDLVAEFCEGLINEGVSLESIELETPQKFLLDNTPDRQLNTPRHSPGKHANSSSTVPLIEATRQIDFTQPPPLVPICLSDATITSTNITQNDYAFQPSVISTPAPPSFLSSEPPALVPIGSATWSSTNAGCKTISLPASALNSSPELIAVPIPGQPNCFQLAKVLATGDALPQSVILPSPEKPNKDTRYTTPYDSNFTWEYISIKKHVYSEYMDKFENLRYVQSNSSTVEALTQTSAGFTQLQHNLLQQQLRLHVQMVTQFFVQTYCHPEFWKLATKAKNMLLELQTKAEENVSFNACNLNGAVELVKEWEQDLEKDNSENQELMRFIHEEIDKTKSNSRQIPRFAPRIMDRMLSSNVFIYPQYLPRIPFTPKFCSFHAFSPAESQLIAFGLEKHMTRIRDSGERISKKASPLVCACERLSMDTVHGKTKRRIWDYIKMLRKSKNYNPVKFYFEHNRAPPIEQVLLPFDIYKMVPPKERFLELPLAWQNYIERQKTETTKKATAPRNSKATQAIVSDEARSCYLEFVREAVGESIQLPENFTEAAQPDGSVSEEAETPTSLRKQQSRQRPRQPKTPTSLTINVNYVFGSALNTSAGGLAAEAAFGATTPTSSITNHSADISGLSASQTLPSNLNWTQVANSTPIPAPAASCDASLPAVAYNYDYRSHTLELVTETNERTIPNSDRRQRKLTDFFDKKSVDSNKNTKEAALLAANTTKRPPKFHKRLRRLSYFHIASRDHRAALQYRQKRLLQVRCGNLLHAYRRQLQTLGGGRFLNAPLLWRCYRRFKALQLYTDLLVKLKMFCRQSAAALNAAGNASVNSSASATISTNGCHSPGSLSKRSRLSAQPPLEDEVASAATRGGNNSKKSNRQEENFRHMLLPDTAEDANRKDAIYAFNFYEKVEEVLKSSSRPEDCKQFNYILKSFDPKRGKVSDLYYKLENLFLPDHPELAHVFLTFLLPAEAAEVGKFFEHFMVTNVSTFINKLNVYFNKQPAQIRKIYNCLNELAEDSEVTIKKIEAKILPLLKGNQFLIDWFLQQFPEEQPPERLLSTPEHINLKEVQNNQSGEFIETVTDLLDSPTSEQQQCCQLRYINGRIFYGSKMTLPAKLSFMASGRHSTSFSPEKHNETDVNNDGCIHGIRNHGEKRLAAAAAAAATAAAAECNSDDNEKSEEDDVSKSKRLLIIDTTASEEDTCSSIETCDDATLRAHAFRLNPSYYSSSCFSTSTSTPNPSSSHHPTHANHANAKSKSSLNFSDEGKISPRKQGAPSFLPTHASLCHSPNSSQSSTAYIGAVVTTPALLREKRKSPTKKNKSPICMRTRVNPLLPMVVIHEQSSAIACAKKLKSLIEAEDGVETTGECPTDSKDHLAIVARAKSSLRADNSNQDVTLESCHPHLVAKIENSDDLEFLPEDATVPHPTLSQCVLTPIKMDLDLSVKEIMPTENQQQHFVSSSHFESDEDCKLDVVATLASTMETTAEHTQITTSSSASTLVADSSNVSTTSSSALPSLSDTTAVQTAWTRDEDKIILIEMKLGSRNRDDLFQRIRIKLPRRALTEIIARHQFLMDFLSKLQGN